MKAWNGFKKGNWQNEINVSEFIKLNYTEYLGDSKFLSGPTEASLKLNEKFNEYLTKEKENCGVIDMDTKVVASITSHDAGYISKDLEKIVGLQTDMPFKRAFHPYGGIRVAYNAAKAYGYEIDEEVTKIFTEHRKTHNDGVFDVYNDAIRKARRSGVV